MAKLKKCPRCWYGTMHRYQVEDSDDSRGWECWLCSLSIADDGHMFDTDGRVWKEEMCVWPLKEEYEPIFESEMESIRESEL